MIWKYIFNRRFFLIVLIGLSAPFWLLLRSWYGWRFFMVLTVATLFYVPALFIALPIILFFETILTGKEAFTDLFITSLQPFYFVIVLYGALIQIPLLILTVLRNTSGYWPKPNPGYVGNFIIWPSSFPQFPVDLMVVAGLFYALFGGHITYYDIREFVVLTNVHLASVGIWMPDIPELKAFNNSFLVPMGAYVSIVLLAKWNNGLLPLFDAGLIPKRQPKPSAKPLIARIYNRAKHPSDTLGAIFSRRDPSLKRITND